MFRSDRERDVNNVQVTPRFKRVAVNGDRHFERLRSCACCVPGCQNTPVVVHHERRGTGGGTGLKPGPEAGINICFWHHDLGHRTGWVTCEQAWGVDLREIARGQAIISRAMGLLPK